jgi:cell division protein FtsQ
VRSSLFAARTVDVNGASRLTVASVLRTAGLSSRTNVVALDAGAAEDRLERHPWVARASIEKHLPSTLEITIVERAPVLAVVREGSSELLAADGTVLGDGRDYDGLPVVRAPPAIRRRPEAASTADAAAALGEMAARVRAGIDRVRLAPDGSLVLRLDSGAIISYGAPTEMTAKARTLAALLRWDSRDGARLVRVDLRAPLAPTADVRP